MHPVIYLNRTMVEAAKARVAPVSSAMLYGRGVFSTVPLHGARLVAAALARLLDHSGRLGVMLRLHRAGRRGRFATNLMNRAVLRARVILLALGRDFWPTKLLAAKRQTADHDRRAQSSRQAIRCLTFSLQPFSPLGNSNRITDTYFLENRTRELTSYHLNDRGIVSATKAIFLVKDGTFYPTLSPGLCRRDAGRRIA